MTIQSLPLQDVADKCYENTKSYYEKKISDPKWCFELFRRALRLGEQDAFTHTYSIFKPQVERWARTYANYKTINPETEDFAHDALIKFWLNLKGEKFDKFPRLNALLAYLKACVFTVVRDHDDEPDLIIIDDLERIIGINPSLDKNINTDDLLDFVEKALNDGDLMTQFELWIIYDMKPSAIIDEVDGGDDAQEISRMRQKIKRHLQKDKNLRVFLDDRLPPITT
ncbi:MAG: hypothetical protein L0154_18000 [Chloroflexi bacterium]|nr:hypothetical protein [Chloroflexota bacterium]